MPTLGRSKTTGKCQLLKDLNTKGKMTADGRSKNN
jgi:hypothetical protein